MRSGSGRFAGRQEVLELILETEPTAMVMANHRGNIAIVNSTAERLFGYSRNELTGRPLNLLISEESADPGRSVDLERGRFGSGTELVVDPGRVFFGHRQDGARFSAGVRLTRIPIDRETWILASVVDTTERQKNEAALCESQTRFETMANASPVMLWMSGPDKLCTFFNTLWLQFRGRTMDQEIGNGWAEGVHPDDLGRCLDIYSTSFDRRERFKMEYRLRRHDSEYRWIVDMGAPMFGSNDQFMGYIGSGIDITDFKRSQRDAFQRQSLQSIGVVTSGIAHDFGNILSGIIAHAELLEADLPPNSSTGRELRTIGDMATRGSEIVRELLTYAGEQKTAVTQISISAVVEEMLNLLKVSIPKNIKFTTKLRGDLPQVLASAPHIRQVVMNLVINASEAIGDGTGCIQVTTTGSANLRTISKLPRGDYVCLEVIDSGRGMGPDVQAKIFDPFFTTKAAGRGLGLAVVQVIVEECGGVMDVTSAPGQGTRFRIMFPVVEHATPHNSANRAET